MALAGGRPWVVPYPATVADDEDAADSDTHCVSLKATTGGGGHSNLKGGRFERVGEEDA